MSKLSEELATHRHFKGGLYRVLYEGVGDANNGRNYEKKSTVYQSIETGEISSRYTEEFEEFVEHNNRKIRRFFPLVYELTEILI